MNRVLHILMLLSVLLAGCDRSPTATRSEPVVHRAVEPVTETWYEVRFEPDTIGVADRLWVIASWRWTQGVETTLVEPDWAAHDWTVIQSIHEAPQRDEDGYLAQWRVLLEPFLPGAYTIPSGSLRVESPLLAQPVSILIQEPMAVSVMGVLAEGDRGELNPIADPTLPSDQSHETSGHAGLIIAIVVSTVALMVLVVMRRDDTRGHGRSIAEQLVQIRDQSELDREEGFRKLERIFDRLDPRLRNTSEFRGMIRTCEQARYACESDAHASPSKIAAYTLELLGDDHEPSMQTGGIV